jgi:hemoglobin
MHGRAYVALMVVPDSSATDTVSPEVEAGRVRPSASNSDRAMRALAVDPLDANEDRPDLTTRRQIHDLVVAFYRELVNDVVLGPVFEEVAEVDWSHHIPLLIDYWCRILLGDQSYQGTLLMAHRRVHDLQPFTTEHFDRWYGQWVATIDSRWSGSLAEKAKAHAARIATTLARQLPQIAWDPVEAEACT